MSKLHSNFLKEMGISEWVSRESAINAALSATATPEPKTLVSPLGESSPRVHWWFFGAKPQGEAQLLFQNIIKVLGLSPREWSWNLPSDDLSKLKLLENGAPVVAFAFGAQAAQQITGERDPLPQLRETILSLKTGNDDEIPVVASQDLMQVVRAPTDKSMLWQDLLLAKSVLQNS